MVEWRLLSHRCADLKALETAWLACDPAAKGYALSVYEMTGFDKHPGELVCPRGGLGTPFRGFLEGRLFWPNGDLFFRRISRFTGKQHGHEIDMVLISKDGLEPSGFERVGHIVPGESGQFYHGLPLANTAACIRVRHWLDRHKRVAYRQWLDFGGAS